MHGLLAENDSPSPISEMPIEDRQATLESMCLAARTYNELEGNVVRRATVGEQRWDTDRATVVRNHGLPECRLLTKNVSRL
ncbi:MAG TPA: hypothetical protein VFT47_12240 [Vicinamibacterales bacterium]|nr:hypothetical protein [Vicinamibacterales bacterium]